VARETTVPWSQVSAGAGYTLAIDRDGALWGMGYNEYGQLGLGTTISHNEPTQIFPGTEWLDVSAGKRNFGDPGAFRFGHSMAIRADGTLWGWGRNVLCQIGAGGAGDCPDVHEPVEIAR
jgi:hypothetical protein